MLQQVVSAAIDEASTLMDKLGMPEFGEDMLSKIQDFDMSTPGQGLASMNEHLWGENPQSRMLSILQGFAGSRSQVLFFMPSFPHV